MVTERDSRRVLIVDPEGGDPVVAGEVDEAVPQGEAGLLGVAVSPDFERDRLLYLYVSASSDNRILRAELGTDDTLGAREVVLDGIPLGEIHDGGRMEFGSDGFLYASTGETGDGALSQDLDSLGGKILRITPNGRPAPGNPPRLADSGATATATSRASPSTTTAGCGPVSSASRRTTSST